MNWLQSLDATLFRFINSTLSHPALDWIMRWFASSWVPTLAAVVVLLLMWKGRARGLICVLMLLFALSLSDWVCNTIKYGIGRPRPFLALPEVQVLVGKGASFSMPSAHAANFFAVTLVSLIYFRRSGWFMLPLAVLMCFSRVYVGVHYPSDVVVGALVGAGSAAAITLGLSALWRWAGQRWFPFWWWKMPSLLDPKLQPEVEESERPPAIPNPGAVQDAQWVYLGYVVIVIVLVTRLLYIAGDTIELTGDEAYQWLWSKHLALSYFSKPPLIAYTQFLGTSLWGDTAFGVRFFSPIIAALLSLLLLRFLAREVNARAGFLLVLISTATPLLAAGAVLMTIDPLLVLFWTAAMISGWRAVQPASQTRHWLWTGLWMGLGFLSKYTALLQWVCWAVFFVLWRPARAQLRRPGPYLALLINLACTLPVLIWNAQHDWITIAHVADNADIGAPAKPVLRHGLDVLEFIGAEAGLFNPVFFAATVAAGVLFWRKGRYNPTLVYFFSMGAPLFLCYFLWSFHSRILPNWIAPSVLPLFCLMVTYWDTQWRLGLAKVRLGLIAGCTLGMILVVFGHETNLIGKFTGSPLPAKIDPLRRARGWKELARVVGQARTQLESEGKPVFIIAGHYSVAGEISFYLPEARANVCSDPMVYCQTAPTPINQFYFWPGYTMRKGENALFVRGASAKPPPAELLEEFDSVTEIGSRQIRHRGRVLREVQLFACRNLK